MGDGVALVLKAAAVGEFGLNAPLCRLVIHPLDKSGLSAADVLGQDNHRAVAGGRHNQPEQGIHLIPSAGFQALQAGIGPVVGNTGGIGAGGDIGIQGQVACRDFLEH